MHADDRDSGVRLAELAAWFGDDIAYRHDSYGVDLAGLPMMSFALRHAGTGRPAPQRLRVSASLALAGHQVSRHGLAGPACLPDRRQPPGTLPARDREKNAVSDSAAERLPAAGRRT